MTWETGIGPEKDAVEELAIMPADILVEEPLDEEKVFSAIPEEFEDVFKIVTPSADIVELVSDDKQMTEKETATKIEKETAMKIEKETVMEFEKQNLV